MTAFVKGKVTILLQQGVSVRHISRTLNVPRSTIRSWRGNAFSLSRLFGSGRKRKTSSRSDRSLLRAIRSDPSLSSTEAQASVAGVSISARSVRRRLQAEGFKSRKRRSSIELTGRHKKARAIGQCGTVTGVLSGIESSGLTKHRSVCEAETTACGFG